MVSFGLLAEFRTNRGSRERLDMTPATLPSPSLVMHVTGHHPRGGNTLKINQEIRILFGDLL